MDSIIFWQQIEDGKTQRRRYTWTWCNYPDDHKELIEALEPSYCIYGKEIAPTTGTKHLQSYFEFDQGKRVSTISKKCRGMRLFISKGTAEQNKAYCTKDDEYTEFGEPTEQGKRSDILSAMEDIRAGKKELEMLETHPAIYCKYPKFMDRYKMAIQKKQTGGYSKKDVRVYYGISGTGKTRSAVEEFPDAFKLSMGLTGMWWTGYDDEDVVILDEFRGTIPLCQLLGILDGYQYRVSVHGGMKYLLAKTIIITSNLPPEEWYTGGDLASTDALMRRIDEIRYYHKKDQFTKVK